MSLIEEINNPALHVGEFTKYFETYKEISGPGHMDEKQLKAYLRKLGWTWTETPEENEFGPVLP